MMKSERQSKIIELLNENQKVISSELSKQFNVSIDTIRRDLKELEKKGLVRSVHSGALKVGPSITGFFHRLSVNNEVKKRLAEKTLPLIEENSIIIIDGGTTNLHLVESLPVNFKATIVTNSPPIAMELGEKNPNVEVLMLGGELYKESMVNLGIWTVQSIKDIRADTYIIGVHNIDSSNGISMPTLKEASVKKEMANVSNEIICMASENKLETLSNHIVIPTEKLSYLVTDSTEENIIKGYKDKSVRIIQEKL